MEGVEDIPAPVMHEGLTWQWESFPGVSCRVEAPEPGYRYRLLAAACGRAGLRYGGPGNPARKGDGG